MNTVAEPETALDRAVAEAVAAAPPLTDDKRELVSRLLSRGGEE